MFDPVARIRKVKSKRSSKQEERCQVVVVVVGEKHLRGNDRTGKVLEEHAKGS